MPVAHKEQSGWGNKDKKQIGRLRTKRGLGESRNFLEEEEEAMRKGSGGLLTLVVSKSTNRC